MAYPVIHKSKNGYIICRTRKIDNKFIFGTENDSEVTCKVCSVGGQSNFRKTKYKRPKNMTATNDLSKLLEKVNYEIKYVDFPNGFTVPVILTKERALRLLDDKSILEVRFTPILGAYMSVTFEPCNLVYSCDYCDRHQPCEGCYPEDCFHPCAGAKKI